MKIKVNRFIQIKSPFSVDPQKPWILQSGQKIMKKGENHTFNGTRGCRKRHP